MYSYLPSIYKVLDSISSNINQNQKNLKPWPLATKERSLWLSTVEENKTPTVKHSTAAMHAQQENQPHQRPAAVQVAFLVESFHKAFKAVPSSEFCSYSSFQC